MDCRHSANSVECRLTGTEPVSAHPQGASPYALEDMAGNAWEWCADWYDPRYYRYAPADNPTGSPEGTRREMTDGSWWGTVKSMAANPGPSGPQRVLRGGSWSWYKPDPRLFRTSNPFANEPEVRVDNSGFRCATDEDAPSP